MEVAETVVYVYLGAHLGLVIRIALDYVTELLYNKETIIVGVIYHSFLANIIGCFLMGLISNMLKTRWFTQRKFLSTGVSTGVLGSVTTFSGWNFDIAYKFLELEPVSAITSLVIGYSTCVIFYNGGKALSAAIFNPYKSQNDEELPLETIHCMPLALILSIIAVCVTVAMIISSFYIENTFILALVLGPAGMIDHTLQ
eukprot:TRINITY_DN902_c0_g1_i2.p1 TRINITY_DN902_c0_g1~~TRINITY_DN902_c0_g1_i2.p1  ORF type:complete len:199 (-),score=24.41 TRINITY_DN902_c0_g1_i2:373-969(-)